MPMREDRDDVAVGVVALVDAVDVEVAQADALERVELGVGQAQLLGAELAGAVRACPARRDGPRRSAASSARRRCRPTTRTRPCARRAVRAASSTVSVPSTLISESISGCSIEPRVARPTPRGGRRRRRRPWPRRPRPASRTSPSTSRHRRERVEVVAVARRQVVEDDDVRGRAPASSATMFEPMNPAPPVTTALVISMDEMITDLTAGRRRKSWRGRSRGRAACDRLNLG